ncbi:MAG: hypothetical protein ABSA83_18290 [Verrucomicrobiota bacterium]|jgi:hypothetical protein
MKLPRDLSAHELEKALRRAYGYQFGLRHCLTCPGTVGLLGRQSGRNGRQNLAMRGPVFRFLSVFTEASIGLI